MTITQKQCLLTYLGYYAGEIDGKFGPQSVAATEAFQRAYELEPDGKFGPATEKRILEVISTGEEPQAPEIPADWPSWWADIRYFRRDEFRCKCQGKYCTGFPAEPKAQLLRLADQVREHFGSPVYVSSGVRCPTHNANVGGKYNSRHLSGKAMDFRVSGISGAALLAYVQTLPGVRYAYQIQNADGTLTDYVHMDVD